MQYLAVIDMETTEDGSLRMMDGRAAKLIEADALHELLEALGSWAGRRLGGAVAEVALCPSMGPRRWQVDLLVRVSAPSGDADEWTRIGYVEEAE